ncbi:hypothetical protein ABXS69_03040 [Actinomyces timonensis]|uniref:Uncharacterized protein n=1 Tax=Actinomyces timonensis TaxID=1288391 RepID=A0AAU8N7L2_9ACTO
MNCARCTLADLGMTVSTGRVVEFRSREYLAHEQSDGAVPMVYPANITRQRVVHPRDSVRKPQWFRATEPVHTKFLVPAGTYVLLKRFSAKEGKRRLVAAVWPEDGRQPAFDNKLKYIHRAGHRRDPEVAIGGAVWLNSNPVDDYYRAFSGHTQANAGDLRQMRFPSLDQLCQLGQGSHIHPENNPCGHLAQRPIR